jgi:hypothetical protein
MKYHSLLLGAAVLAATLLTACGGDSHSSGSSVAGGSSSSGAGSSSSSSGASSSSSGATMQSLDTAQVLALAQVQSETTDPFAVDGGALTLDDTSDSTQPAMISAH